MKTARAAAVLALLIGLVSADVQNLDFLRLLLERPLGSQRWDRRQGQDQPQLQTYDDARSYQLRASTKRSALATVLHAGRPRRQPAPALGKPGSLFLGVGILNDMDTFFGALRGNLHGVVSPPNERTPFYEPPTVVNAPTFESGGGSGMQKLHALRPLRPTGNIRSYNRRSFVEGPVYPGANRHDPGLLWTGLGR